MGADFRVGDYVCVKPLAWAMRPAEGRVFYVGEHVVFINTMPHFPFYPHELTPCEP